MDKATRNLIERATGSARRLLEQEFAQQLEGIYDILRSGEILPQAGPHLDARGRATRAKLVAAVEFRRQGGESAKDGVAGVLREAAFTTLNRFVALKMLEARGLVQECISMGEQSAGFKEYSGLAGGLVTLPDRGYRLYIESLFDEIGREVRVLFDRRDVAGQLWPRRQALLDLLAILNDQALVDIWGEDETSGWVYQYFNGEDERKKMREESQAPRNSRELAVRNQFFTPRYVVEFLTDNTLGRMWYEMRGGVTVLLDRCRYLVRRPDEAIPGRPRKDPRDLKILDPACGSGHFLLYCFDLLLAIYEEAWADEHDPAWIETGRTLRQDFPTLDRLRREVPGLILAHNLHGIDIDPRAAQIAELALWMRAQRAYSDFRIPATDRPLIRKTNIVVAEAMPGDPTMLEEFLRGLDVRLRPLVRTIWQKMHLAGEVGSLLRIEDEISSAVKEARRDSLVDAPPVQVSLFEPDRVPVQQVLVAPEEERSFWDRAESQLLAALRTYATQASGGLGMQRRLFAENATQGFAFVDLAGRRYDVVLMNPPFGAASRTAKSYIESAYPSSKNDLYTAFVERGLSWLPPSSLLGAITSRTGFFLGSFQKWREKIILGRARPTVVADLGSSVLDAAKVQTAAYCLEAK